MTTKPLNRTRSAVPACMRNVSLKASKAHEKALRMGAKAARYGLSCDVNPHRERSPLWRTWNKAWKENAE
jgi:hypothetical protein